MNSDLGSITSAFPSSFGFYALGDVRLDSRDKSYEPIDLTAKTTLAFSIFGNETVSAIVIFDRNSDESLYSEIGNVILSRTADNIAAKLGREVLISSPRKIHFSSVPRIIATATGIERLIYLHSGPTGLTEITILLIPSSLETANA